MLIHYLKTLNLRRFSGNTFTPYSFDVIGATNLELFSVVIDVKISKSWDFYKLKTFDNGILEVHLKNAVSKCSLKLCELDLNRHTE